MRDTRTERFGVEATMSAARRRTSKRASFVVVANRLPVDRFENPDGSVEWRTSPGGLVTAFEPVMRTHRGAWVGWPGSPDDDIEPFTHNDLQLEPVHLSRRGRRALLRGLLERHAVAALPRRRRSPGLPPRVVGPLRDRQRALRRGGGPRSPTRAVRCGSRTTSSSWCRRCCASCDPTCGSGSSCTSRSPPPSCSSSCPGAARSCRGCSAPTWSASSCPAAPRTSSGWCGSGSPTRPAGIGSARPTAARSSPGRTRSRSTPGACTSWPWPTRRPSARRGDPGRSR